MAPRPKLSLCMIVKDGGASLTRCLESARGVADELVVVDTGSSDDSVARARAAGARVLSHEWRDDFAAARNASLDAARGEWVLVLDCDERFDPPHPPGLRAALERDLYAGYFLPIESELAGGEKLESTILRLWRHSPQVRFRFPIHEQVLPDLEPLANRRGQRFALLSDVRIAHDGYTPAEIERHGKTARNLALFEKAVAAHAGEPYLWFKFADFLRGQRDLKARALEAAERALALVRGEPGRSRPPYHSELLTIVCAARLEGGDRAGALEILKEEPPGEIASPHYSYVAALAFEAAGRGDEALSALEGCSTAMRPRNLTAWRPGIAGPQAEALRARLLLAKGDARGAIAAADRAILAKPDYPAAVQLRADALVAAGDPGSALRFLMERARANPGRARIWQQAAALLERLGRPAEARRCLELAQRAG